MSSIVVADAGPLHYLVLIDSADVLGKLFDRIFIPGAVRDELIHGGTPEKVREWILLSHPWLEVQTIADIQPIHGLHQGEIEAIQLALKIQASGVLMDDLDGRKAARSLGLAVVGTLGVLERAAEKGLLNLSEAAAKLRRTNFFVSPELLDAALERERLRRKKNQPD
jgi:predicted nucleic acid-binding protein